jgi:hypothetical protein
MTVTFAMTESCLHVALLWISGQATREVVVSINPATDMIKWKDFDPVVHEGALSRLDAHIHPVTFIMFGQRKLLRWFLKNIVTTGK